MKSKLIVAFGCGQLRSSRRPIIETGNPLDAARQIEREIEAG